MPEQHVQCFVKKLLSGTGSFTVCKTKTACNCQHVKSVGLGSFRGQFVGCFECFKTAVSADNLLGVVGVLRLQLQVCGQFVGVVGVLRLQFPQTICWCCGCF